MVPLKRFELPTLAHSNPLISLVHNTVFADILMHAKARFSAPSGITLGLRRFVPSCLVLTYPALG